MTTTYYGHYEVLNLIGRGINATVYKGWDAQNQREVAIKVLPRKFLQSGEAMARFDREVQIISNLKHPAIVPFYDVGREAGQPFLVTRFMSGGPLAAWIASGPLSLDQAAAILLNIAPALELAHSRGVVHRSLRPMNILFDENNAPCISDFGLAKLDDSIQWTMGAVGPPEYNSPEVARGAKNIDGRSDVYSLGVILFEMLTGDVPFKDKNPLQVATMHVSSPIPSICERRPELPAEADEVIGYALAKDPNGRYQTPSQLANAVVALAEIAAQNEKHGVVTGERKSAQKMVSAAGIGIMLAICLLLVGATLGITKLLELW